MIGLKYFNTSNVNNKQDLEKQIIKINGDFNTSNVNNKLLLITLVSICHNHFNTSNVNNKRKLGYEIVLVTQLFQYIKC